MTRHDADLAEALWLADASGKPVGQVVLIGVTPESVKQGVGLTPALEAAIEPAVRAVVAELTRAGVAAVPLVPLW
jgi:hydrogenase maturation protease